MPSRKKRLASFRADFQKLDAAKLNTEQLMKLTQLCIQEPSFLRGATKQNIFKRHDTKTSQFFLSMFSHQEALKQLKNAKALTAFIQDVLSCVSQLYSSSITDTQTSYLSAGELTNKLLRNLTNEQLRSFLMHIDPFENLTPLQFIYQIFIKTQSGDANDTISFLLKHFKTKKEVIDGITARETLSDKMDVTSTGSETKYLSLIHQAIAYDDLETLTAIKKNLTRNAFNSLSRLGENLITFAIKQESWRYLAESCNDRQNYKNTFAIIQAIKKAASPKTNLLSTLFKPKKRTIKPQSEKLKAFEALCPAFEIYNQYNNRIINAHKLKPQQTSRLSINGDQSSALETIIDELSEQTLTPDADNMRNHTIAIEWLSLSLAKISRKNADIKSFIKSCKSLLLNTADNEDSKHSITSLHS
jgi:hypothetical protein